MTLKREIKDAYLEGGNSIYVKTHSNAVYVDENETETLTQRLDNVKNSITEHTTQLETIKKPVISFCFDDGFSEDNLTYSIFKEYGMVCSFALITEYALTRNRLELYRQYEKEGFSINSHSCSHLYLGDGTVDDDIANYEIAESKKHMNLWGFPANGFVAGQSVVNEKYIPLLRNNYDFAFTQYWGTLNNSNKGYCDNRTDRYKLGRVSLYRNTTEQIKECIDNCIKDKGCLFFYDHRTGAEGENVSESKLREILSYVKTKVDNKECVVKNNDDAINSYFGVNLKNYKCSKISKNIAPRLSNISKSLKFDTWWLSIHNNDMGESYSYSVVNNEIVGQINYPNGININKESSLQTKIDISKIDFTKHENQAVVLSFDVWSDKKVDLEIYLDSRFYKDLVFDITHRKKVNMTTKRQTFSIIISPYLKQNYDYLLFYPRIKALDNVSEAFSIYLSNPIVSVCNDISLIEKNQISGLIKGKSYTKTLDISSIGNRNWSKYSATVNNALYDGLSDGTGTLKIKNNGIYMITFEGYYKINDVTANSRVLGRVLKSSDTSIESNYRTIGYINGTSGIVNLNSSYVMQCNEGELINIEVFLDSTVGTITELEKARIRVELISD